MAENVLKVCHTRSTRPVPTSGWVFFLAETNDTHPSVSQPYPFSTGTEMKPSLEAIGGPKQSPSGQNLNPGFFTIQEDLKVSLWVSGWADRWAEGCMDGWMGG